MALLLLFEILILEMVIGITTSLLVGVIHPMI